VQFCIDNKIVESVTAVSFHSINKINKTKTYLIRPPTSTMLFSVLSLAELVREMDLLWRGG
jgi:hypothetical protein